VPDSLGEAMFFDLSALINFYQLSSLFGQPAVNRQQYGESDGVGKTSSPFFVFLYITSRQT